MSIFGVMFNYGPCVSVKLWRGIKTGFHRFGTSIRKVTSFTHLFINETWDAACNGLEPCAWSINIRHTAEQSLRIWMDCVFEDIRK
jgi:hypothetical protein